MPTRHRRRSRFSFLLLPFAFTLVAGYFSWQSTRGAYSYEAREVLQAERDGLEATLSATVAEREALEDRVRRLRTDALDADLLDERARSELNMAFSNEMVIFHRNEEPPSVAAFAAHGR